MKTYDNHGHRVENGTFELTAHEAMMVIGALAAGLEFVDSRGLRAVYHAGNFTFVINPNVERSHD